MKMLRDYLKEYDLPDHILLVIEIRENQITDKFHETISNITRELYQAGSNALMLIDETIDKVPDPEWQEFLEKEEDRLWGVINNYDPDPAYDNDPGYDDPRYPY